MTPIPSIPPIPPKPYQFSDNGTDLSPKKARGINLANGEEFKINGVSISGAVQDRDELQGMALDKTDGTIVNTAGTLYFEVEKLGGGDIRFLLDGVISTLDCTTGAGTGGKARVALSAGADQSSPKTNYLYATNSGGTSTLVSSATTPSGSIAWVAQCAVPDATTFNTTGAYSHQRFTDSLLNDSRGALSHEREKIRTIGASYSSGVDQTVTITTNVGSADNVKYTTNAGIIYQMHQQNYPAMAAPVYYVANDNTTPYITTTDLNTLLTDADGDSMSGRRFSLVIWGAVNKTTGECKIFVNLPTGSYSNNNLAINDRDNLAVYSVPDEFSKTAFLISRLVLRHSTTSGGTWTELNNIDLRGVPIASTKGGTAAGSEFSDASFEIFDNSDETKIAKFENGSITTGNTRTLTVPDKSGTIALTSDLFAPTKTITISPSGGDYTSIQSALDANTSGGELFLVYPGTYTDTINFTANNQCIKGIGNAPQQIVQQADATVCDFDAYTGCYVERVNIKLTAPTAGRDAITGTGDCLFQLCRLETYQSGAITGTQSTIINTSGTVRIYLSTCVYQNTSVAAGGDRKEMFNMTGTGSIITTDVELEFANTGTCFVSTVTVLDVTGTFLDITNSKITGFSNSGIVAGITDVTIGGSHKSHDNIYIISSDGNDAYGIYASGTDTYFSSQNHFHITTNSGNAYGFYIGGSMTVKVAGDDIIAADGNSIAGTLDGTYSLNQENFVVTGIATLGDGSTLATSAAPTTDAMITNKKYVDDNDEKRWTTLTATTDFSMTAPTTSTITMVTDQTANIKVGMPLRYTISSVVYYGLCSAITSNLLTIEGAPLTTGAGDLTALAYGQPEMVTTLRDFYAGNLVTGDDQGSPALKWQEGEAYIVKMIGQLEVAPTGTNDVRVSAGIGGATTDLLNSPVYLELGATNEIQSGVNINTSNYNIARGEKVFENIDQIGSTIVGGGLSLNFLIVKP